MIPRTQNLAIPWGLMVKKPQASLQKMEAKLWFFSHNFVNFQAIHKILISFDRGDLWLSNDTKSSKFYQFPGKLRSKDRKPSSKIEAKLSFSAITWVVFMI